MRFILCGFRLHDWDGNSWGQYCRTCGAGAKNWGPLRLWQKIAMLVPKMLIVAGIVWWIL